ncbi:MAG TPA: alginate lyase family protein [Polyangiaceae bacterium]|nr:alginate lyase family protein [Polyangiaceae bacterium]
MKSSLRLAVVLIAASLGVGCGRFDFRRAAANESNSRRVGSRVPLEPNRMESRADHSGRIVLDLPALTRLRDAARQQTPAFRNTEQRANDALARPIASGYQGFEWADAVASLALMWQATGDARYAQGAITYLNALLDDRFAVGDGKGGDAVVRYDSGYGIRTFGAYSALAYDWLRQAPGMTDSLRKKILQRLEHWISWYQEQGYLRDQAISNYYWGYLTTLSFAGLAAAGESAAADRWLEQARRELSERVLPIFRDQLAGGGWPEGWQYGEYTTLEIALVAKAMKTGAGVDVLSKLPWLGQVVIHHAHALLPDESSVYDGGTWGEHPAVPSGLAVAAVSIALDGVDAERVAQARWLAAHALPPLRREQAWVGLLAERLDAEQRSPRDGATSLLVSGQGLAFVRSDWSHSSVWASFQAGPHLAEDHQDADQGHFELFRGADGLLVDGGGSEGSATINHNCLLVDDGGEVMNYPPNQGVWGLKVKTTRFGDDGVAAVAVGDLTDAYAPKCIVEGCSKRAVESMTRSFVFVRPSLLVIDDRVTTNSPETAVTWAAHVTKLPAIASDLASAVVGQSRVDIRTIEPSGAHPLVRREPTPSGEGSHRLNQPWGPMWRIEVTSPVKRRERSFLHFITAGPANAQAPLALPLHGQGLSGAIGGVGGRVIAVLFNSAPSSAPVTNAGAALGGVADLVVIAGLTPGKHYRVSLTPPNCELRLTESTNFSDPQAGAGGFLRLTALDCGR